MNVTAMEESHNNHSAAPIFPFPPLVEVIPISLFYSTVFIAGLVGNLTVFLVVCTTRGESILDNCLISLTLADLCVILFCIPIRCARWFSYTWMYGMFLCKAVHYVQVLGAAASAFTIAAIALERFHATFNSLQVISGGAKRRMRILLPSCWLLAVLLATPTIYVQNLYRIPGPFEFHWCIKSFSLRGADGKAIIYELYLFAILIVGPCASIAFAYFRISCLLTRRSLQILHAGVGAGADVGFGSGSSVNIGPTLIISRTSIQSTRCDNLQVPYKRPRSVSQAVENPINLTRRVSINTVGIQNEKVKQIVRLLLATVIVFLVSYAPLQIDNILQAFGVLPRFNPQPLKTIRMLTSLLSSVNSALNPYVYCFMSTKFRMRVKSRLNSLIKSCSRRLQCWDKSHYQTDVDFQPCSILRSSTVTQSPTNGKTVSTIYIQAPRDSTCCSETTV